MSEINELAFILRRKKKIIFNQLQETIQEFKEKPSFELFDKKRVLEKELELINQKLVEAEVRDMNVFDCRIYAIMLFSIFFIFFLIGYFSEKK